MQTDYQTKKPKSFITSMPKLLLGLLLTTSQISFSQVANYTFSQNEGTYTELINPTNIATPTALTGTGSIDDQVYSLPENTIPFEFSINENQYTSLKVFANGFITFGTVSTGSSSPISETAGYSAVISALGSDLHAIYNINDLTGSISYETVGTAPNREFVIQWQHFRPYSSSTSTQSLWDWNFQIRLKEDNTIAIVYDLSVTGTPTSSTAEVGLRGATNSDFNNRTSSGTATSNWTLSSAGTNNYNKMTNNSSSLPLSGFTYNWSPPAPCETPTAQPSNLVLTASGIIINGSFTASTPNADRYLVLRTQSGELPNSPTDGVTYTLGNNNDLNAYVSYYGANTTFENNYNHAIRGNNEYTYFVYAVNSACSGGPLYLTDEPLTDSIINCPATVNGITSSNIETDSFQLNWPAPENGTALPIETILEVATDNAFLNHVEGSPFTLDASELTLSLTGLLPNTKYFYRGKTVSTCESVYSSVGNLSTACVAVTEFYENFDAGTGLAVPNCWSKILTSASSSTPTINVSSTEASSQPNNVSFYGNGADTDLETTKIILVSPEILNLGAGTHRLRFKARKTSTTTTPSPTSLQIVALDGNDANANIEVIATFDELTTTYAEYSTYFDSYQGGGSYIGIRRIGGPTYSYLYMDDIIWEAIPACPELVSITAYDFTPDGATITLHNPADQAPTGGYEYFVSTSNTPPTADNTLEPTNSNTITISGLPSGATRHLWARRVCTEDEKSPWKSVSFATILTTPAPWTETFTSSTPPAGWSTTGWSIGTSRGANGNPSTNIYKNIFSTTPTGAFTTIPVGPLPDGSYTLSFDYKQSAYASPYASLENWGDVMIEVSTDFGTTWDFLSSIDNEEGTGGYSTKTYPLSGYANQYVKIRITGNWTAGDFDLSFDNFKINAEDLSTGDFEKSNLKIYPNPTSNFVTVQTDMPIKNIQVYNQLGQLMGTQKDSKIDLSNAAAGIYILHVQLENGSSTTQKIIKK